MVARVTFDLIGLPPTPEELAAFDKDASADAFGKVVDRLLASPHFGERWGRHWLDIVRFAESSGGGRSLIFNEAWRYRDYVISSLNGDKPYNQFLTEQIAGDLLPSKSLEHGEEQMVATAFWMLGATNYEEQDKKVLEMDVVDEQLDTMGRALMGMTIGCARCHDHKFDPIPTRDYYALAGILRSTDMLIHENVSRWTERALPQPPEQEKAWDVHFTAVTDLQKQIKTAKDAVKKMSADVVDLKKGPIAAKNLPGLVLDDTQAKRIGEWTASKFSGSFIGEGYLHDGDKDKGEKTLTFTPEFSKAGTYEVRLAYVPGKNRASNVPVKILHLDGDYAGKIDQQQTPSLDGRFVSLGRFPFDETNQWFVMISNEGTDGHVVVDAVQFLPVDGVDAVAKTADAGKAKDADKPGDVKSTDTKPADNKPVESATKPKENDAVTAKNREIAEMEKQLKVMQAKAPPHPLAMAVKDAKTIDDCAICIRGNVHQRGDKIPRGFLQVASVGPLSELPSSESGRRELADWITRPDHPLTTRVLVNRVWQHLFGDGLVRTVDNFGNSGELPSHPELLDNLAVKFVDEGWSIKKLIRSLVLSHTYRQSSAARADLAAGDPENRLLGRMHRRRLDAEAIRDSILVVSHQLNETIGGQTIRPPEKSAANQANPVEYGYVFTDVRRSVYTPLFRNRLLELFETFDFADPNSVVGRRNVSTVAPQALYLLNNPFVMDQAEKAAKVGLESPNLSKNERIEQAFLTTLGRSPTKKEQALALSAVSSAKEDDPQANLAAWQRLYQALFGCIDFRYLD